MITKFKKPVAASGTTIENEPIIKSDGASSDVMQWLSNDESSNITISEDGSNNLDLVVSAGNVGLAVTPKASWISDLAVLQFGEVGALTGGDTGWGGYVELCANSYRDSGGFKRLTADYATLYEQNNANGSHNFKVAATGAADAAITWTSALTIASTGNVVLGTGDIQFTGAANATIGHNGYFDLEFETNGVIRQTISAAGKSTFATAGAISAVFQSTNASYGAIQLNNTATGGDNWYLMSTADGHAHGGGYFSLYNEDTTTHAIKVSPAGLTTVTNPGWPLKNEISNSGFDVWSNSTLVSATTGAAPALEDAGDLVHANEANSGTAWTDATGATPPDGWAVVVAGTFTIDGSSGSGAEPGLKITHDGTTHNPMIAMDGGFTTVIGKLYKVSFRAKHGTTSSDTRAGIGTAIGTDNLGFISFTNGSWADYSHVFEATTTTSHLYFQIATATPGQYSHYDSVMIHEVTPGCVAANSFGCDSWYKSSTTDLFREQQHATYSKDGSFYSLKTLAGSASTEYVYCFGGVNELSDSLEWRERWAGRTVTIGFWVYSVGAADNVKPAIFDGAWNLGSSFAGADAWEWMEFTHTMSATATGGGFGFVLDGDAADVAYISQPMLVFGSAIGSGNYSRPSGEIVWFEKRVNSNLLPATGWSDVAATALNLEADSNGVIPKGANAIQFRGLANDSGSAAALNDGILTLGRDTSTPEQNIRTNGLTNDAQAFQMGWQSCGSDGDIAYTIAATGSATLDVGTFQYLGVQLR